MALLYYWRPDNYARDREFGFGFHLNQNSPLMASAKPGHSLWAFTRRRVDSQYVLAAELVVKAVTENPPNYHYGQWRIWGDLERSRYFDVELGPRLEPVVRLLGIRASAARLGQSFQGHAAVRSLSAADDHTLSTFAEDLPTLSAAALYAEDEFEARIVHDARVRRFVLRETATEQNIRMKYLYETVDIQRARKHVLALQELYDGRCQICLFDPRDRFGHRICHGHHIQWLSRGGEDELENMVLVCPNHHGAIHRDDAVFDYNGLRFTYQNGLIEPLSVNEHLPAA